MNLLQFIQTYDTEGAIVLLEGKRKVAEADVPKLIALGTLLASKTVHMRFRSGNAAGSDQYFAEGVGAVNAGRMQVITPYTGHRKAHNANYETLSLDDINLAAEPEIVYQSKAHKGTESLIDKYVAGAKKGPVIKAAYIIRDTVKVLGFGSAGKATFGLFYDDLANPMTGGTGHTMRTCENNGVPIANQQVWLAWLEPTF